MRRLGGAKLRLDRQTRRELRDAHNTPAFAGASLLLGACPGEGRDHDSCEADKRAEFDPRIFSADPYPADEPLTED